MGAPALILGGGQLIQGVSSLLSGKSASDAAEENAFYARQNAQAELERGIEEERRVRVQGVKAIGSIRAGYAASGLGSEGSALDVLAETASNIESDASQARKQSELRARSYLQEASQESRRASGARTAGFLGASSKIFEAGGTIAASIKRSG